ncbi:hypothetical protein BGZ49_001634 [Haplosporangium sp. Z 27]|nr:hypothetical protein BGZ49_001634 [Haplosporangium sp. Z 27]
MPVYRPQQSHNQAKTTSAASTTTSDTGSNTKSSGNQRNQQQQLQSIVSSPQGSPTNSHIHRFISQELSLAKSRESHPSSNRNATDTVSIGVSSDTSSNAVPSPPMDFYPTAAFSPDNGDVNSSSGSNARPNLVQQAQNYEQNSSKIIALNEARVFSQQLQLQLQQQQQQQQLNIYQQGQNQQKDQSDSSRRTSWMGLGSRSVIGSMMSARGSTAASSVGGTSPVLGGGGGSVNGDELTEQTLLLVRPVWVQDQDAAACRICARTFSAVRRKHHCRQCGQVFCHDCSSRSIALPQLGYPKAVRVCNDCFEVAYLVAYCVSDDLGPSTQIHGARGLYELIITNDEAIQSMIVAKRAMPKLFHIVSAYTSNTSSPARPPSPPVLLTRMSSTSSLHTKSVRRIETIAVVLMNVTHVVLQMVPDRMLAKQIVQEGAIDTLMSLCVYFPAGARSRVAEEAIRVMSIRQSASEDSELDSTTGGSQKSSFDGHSQNPVQRQTEKDHDNEEEETLFSMDDELHSRLENMQSIAAKCISILASDVSNQAFIVDDQERINRMVQLLYSNNLDVVKYVSKTMAYLSLRNDKYKPDIAKGSGAAALLAVIRAASGIDHVSSGNSVIAEAVSHACCALANLATNTESQEILMSHMDLLSSTCAVIGLFPYQRDIERHVARLIANLALYDQNKLALLTAYSSSSEGGVHDRSVSPFPSQSRYSSPAPPSRRAKSNVIPTLLHIGSLTLEKASPINGQGISETYPPLEQDVIDFMNDEGQGANRTNPPGYLTPKDSASMKEPSPLSLMKDENDSTVEDEVSEWTTVPGMEDVQRHIIRAIDNLMTSVTEDPSSNQSFKVFSRIWPTIGLIKTIQMASNDEDTQRRATHVLSVLISQQEIHGEALAALRQNVKVVDVAQEHNVQPTGASSECLVDETTLEDQDQEQQRLERFQKLENDEREKLRKETIEKENVEKERLEKEKLEIEKLEAEKLEKEKMENERLQKEKEKLEAEKLEKERLKKDKKEKRRLEQERLEQERLEKERLEQERLEQERLEQERLEQERLEQERLEEERLEQERLEQERLEEERLEQERLEQERLEQEHLEQERLEEERLEQERLEQERLEKERVGEERVKAERAEQENALAEPDSHKGIEEDGLDVEEGSRGSSSKASSSSEEQTTSQDEEPKPKEKSKKKKKKKSSK